MDFARLYGSPSARVDGSPSARVDGSPSARVDGSPSARVYGSPSAQFFFQKALPRLSHPMRNIQRHATHPRNLSYEEQWIFPKSIINTADSAFTLNALTVTVDVRVKLTPD
jgi:hypothetical protein